MPISDKVIEFKKVNRTKTVVIFSMIAVLLVAALSFGIMWVVTPGGFAGTPELSVVFDDIDRLVRDGREEAFVVPNNEYIIKFAAGGRTGVGRRPVLEYDSAFITVISEDFDGQTGELAVVFGTNDVQEGQQLSITAIPAGGSRRNAQRVDFTVRNVNAHSIAFHSSEIVELAFDEFVDVGPAGTRPQSRSYTSWFDLRGVELGNGSFSRVDQSISAVSLQVIRQDAYGNLLEGVANNRVTLNSPLTAERISIERGLPVIVNFNNESITVRYNNLSHQNPQAERVMIEITANENTNTVNFGGNYSFLADRRVASSMVVELREMRNLRNAVEDIFLFDMQATNVWNETFAGWLNNPLRFDPERGTFPRIMTRIPNNPPGTGYAMQDGRFLFRLNPELEVFQFGASNPFYRYYGFSAFDINQNVVTFPFFTGDELAGRFEARAAQSARAITVTERESGIFAVGGNSDMITDRGQNALELSFTNFSGQAVTRRFDFGVRFRVEDISITGEKNVTLGGTFSPVVISYTLTDNVGRRVNAVNLADVYFDTTVILSAPSDTEIEGDPRYASGAVQNGQRLFRPQLMRVSGGLAVAELGVRFAQVEAQGGATEIRVGLEGRPPQSAASLAVTARAQAAGLMITTGNQAGDTAVRHFSHPDPIAVGTPQSITEHIGFVIFNSDGPGVTAVGDRLLHDDFTLSFSPRIVTINNQQAPTGDGTPTADITVSPDGILTLHRANVAGEQRYAVIVTISRTGGGGISAAHSRVTIVLSSAYDPPTGISFSGADANDRLRTHSAQIVYFHGDAPQITQADIPTISTHRVSGYPLGEGAAHFRHITAGLPSNLTGGERGGTLFGTRIDGLTTTFIHDGADVLRLTFTNDLRTAFGVTVLDGAHGRLSSFSLYIPRTAAAFGNHVANQNFIVEARFNIRRGVDGIRVYRSGDNTAATVADNDLLIGNGLPGGHTLVADSLGSQHPSNVDLENILHNRRLPVTIVPYRITGGTGNERRAFFGGVWDTVTFNDTSGLISRTDGANGMTISAGTVTGAVNATVTVGVSGRPGNSVSLNARIFARQQVNIFYVLPDGTAVVFETVETDDNGRIADPTARLNALLAPEFMIHRTSHWWTGSVNGAIFDINAAITEPTNLFIPTEQAQFTAVVRFLAVIPGQPNLIIQERTIVQGTTVVAPAPPNIAGHNWSNWFPHATDGTAPFDFSNTIDRDTDIFARFTPIMFNVTFRNHNETVFQNVQVQHGHSVAIPINPPTRPGHDFLNWRFYNVEGTRHIANPDLANVTEHMIARPVFRIRSYTVNFVVLFSGQQLIVQSQQVDWGRTVTPPVIDDNTVFGYRLGGSWHWNAPTGEVINNFNNRPIEHNVRIYANLTPITHTVRFVNDVEWFIAEVSVRHGRGVPLFTADEVIAIDPLLIRSGFRFIGWEALGGGTPANVTFGFTMRMITEAIPVYHAVTVIIIDDGGLAGLGDFNVFSVQQTVRQGQAFTHWGGFLQLNGFDPNILMDGHGQHGNNAPLDLISGNAGNLGNVQEDGIVTFRTVCFTVTYRVRVGTTTAAPWRTFRIDRVFRGRRAINIPRDQLPQLVNHNNNSNFGSAEFFWHDVAGTRLTDPEFFFGDTSIMQGAANRFFTRNINPNPSLSDAITDHNRNLTLWMASGARVTTANWDNWFS